jgi:hypothetical protein
VDLISACGHTHARAHSLSLSLSHTHTHTFSIRNDKESLEIEVNLLRSEAERRPHVSLAVHEEVKRDNERLREEFELLKNESMNLIALLGTLESPDPEAIPGCSD